MRVRVLFFGMLKDIAGSGSDTLEVREGASVGDVVAEYSRRVPSLQKLMPSVALAVNQQYAGADRQLNDGDEVALLPPVSGGAGHGELPWRHAAIVREPIDTASLLGAIKQDEDGAAVVFAGVVRNNT